MANNQETLSPSQVSTFFACQARWFFKYKERLPDPASGSLVRGRAVHKLVGYWFNQALGGRTPEAGEMGEAYDEIWDRESSDAVFGASEDIESLKRSGEALASKYLAEAAPEIKVAAVEVPVAGEIGGIPVRGFIDLVDQNGTIIDLKTASRKPSGVEPDYAFQLATYAQLLPGASGNVRLDTIVATKEPQLVRIGYDVPHDDRRMTEKLYPAAAQAMRCNLPVPNRKSVLCSRRYCPFADACSAAFGGVID